jgi:hypothetical protein
MKQMFHTSIMSRQRLGYEMDDQSSIPGAGNDWICFLRHRFQTGSAAHQASYPMGTGGSFPRDKVADHEDALS